MDETTVDHALLDALRKADPGPYPKRIPYTATVRGFLPDPVTALRWATYTAAGTIVLGGAALIVKAMGFTHEASPPTAAEAPRETVQPAVQQALPQKPPVPPTLPRTPPAPARERVLGRTTPTAVPPSEPDRAEPVMLVAGEVDKVTVVPAAYEARHAAPELDVTVLGVRVVAVDLS